MGEIYTNAFFTIAAAMRADCHGGCFDKRPLKSEPPFILNVRTSDGGVGAASISSDDDIFNSRIDFRSESGRNSISINSWLDQQTVLDKRGWTLQESLLSTRIIKYTPQMMFWICRTVSIREDGAIYRYINSQNNEFPHFIEHLHSQAKRMEEILTEKSTHPTLDNSSDSSYRRADLSDLDEIKRQIFIAWYHFIEGYNKRHFTVHSDRLPAIAGVAAKMAAATGDVYLQGIWQSDLSRGLAWGRKEPRSFVEDEDEYEYEGEGGGFTHCNRLEQALLWYL